MRHDSTDNLRCDYIEEINLVFELTSRIDEMESTGETVGSERLKKLRENARQRARNLGEEIQSRYAPKLKNIIHE